jgi:hypothetical protein
MAEKRKQEQHPVYYTNPQLKKDQQEQQPRNVTPDDRVQDDEQIEAEIAPADFGRAIKVAGRWANLTPCKVAPNASQWLLDSRGLFVLPAFKRIIAGRK